MSGVAFTVVEICKSNNKAVASNSKKNWVDLREMSHVTTEARLVG